MREKCRTAWGCIKKCTVDFWHRRDPAEFYTVLMLIGILSVLIPSLFTRFEAARNLFYIRGGDCFMDFFNSMRDLRGGGGVYTERGVIYPPMANLIFLIFSKFMPQSYLNTPFADRQTWSDYPVSWVVCFAFLILLGLCLILATAKHYPKRLRPVLAVLTVCNFSVLVGFERGNIVLLSTAALLFYILSYESESKLTKELGLLALAFAASLKFYPAVFGWFLLVDKRYKEAGRCVLYAGLMFLLPSFFFGGPQCLIWLVENIAAFSSSRIYGGDPWYLWFQNGILTVPYYIVFGIGVVVFLLMSFTKQKRWKLWTFATVLILCFPPLRGTYAWVMILAPLILFFKEEKLQGSNILYFLIMTLPLIPIPIRLFDQISLGELFVIHGAMVLLWLCLMDSFLYLYRCHKEKKSYAT